MRTSVYLGAIMIKRIFLALALLWAIPVTAQDFPKVIDKTWILSGGNVDNGFVVYTDMSRLAVDDDLKATTLWVKQLSFKEGKIRVQRWAFRNKGEEFVVLGTTTYTGDMKFISSMATPREQLQWGLVVPGTIAEGVRDTVLQFLEFLKKSQQQQERSEGTKNLL
jgi:hypothetical protein